MPLNSPRRFRQLSAWALLLAQSALLAQDFRITEAVLNAAGRLELGFPAEATSYYRLIEGAAPEAVNRTVGLGLTPPLIPRRRPAARASSGWNRSPAPPASTATATRFPTSMS